MNIKWVLLAWHERNTDVTTHAAWGIPAYENTRRVLHYLSDIRFALLGNR